ncbi:MAG: hypothetical protein ACJ795_03700 [Ktedonobacteraceae bacterium]
MSQQQQGKNKDWKDYLLKSSLPLEQIVSEKLDSNHWYIDGEFPYIRPNEQDINTEFSVDLRAFALAESIESGDIDTYASLDLLIECKYNYPGTRWVFSAPPKAENLYNGGIYCLFTQGRHKIFPYPDLKACSRGIVLTNTGSDPNSIAHGLNQLRYGMPNLIVDEMRYGRDQTSPSYFICLLLVTTADLYILKPRQTLETYQVAQSLDDIAERVDALVVSQEIRPSLRQYFYQRLGSLRKTEFYAKIGKQRQSEPPEPEVNPDDFIPEATEVIVVHLDAFETTINSLLQKARTNFRTLLDLPSETEDE